jgi:hypothetical protein
VVTIYWTPTFARCGFASQIALAIRRKLEAELTCDYKMRLIVRPEDHEDALRSKPHKKSTDK